jgi:phosphatidylinositol glycan class S
VDEEGVGYVLLPSPRCVAEWERVALFARFLSLSLQSALHDLRALVALVETVPHMPVDEDIARLVGRSIEAAATARAHCEAGRWEACGKAALQCSTYAHEAFYAPSLLPSLYFPEEHVYAVYAPLFLPIGLPVLAAVVARVRQWRKRKTV